MGYTASAPEGHERQSQAGPKGRQLEVEARRAPRLLVFVFCVLLFIVVGVCLQILLVLHHPHSIHHSLPLPQTPKMERMRPGSTIIHHYFHLFHLFMK